MLSPKVIELEKRCRDTQSAATAYGHIAAAEWGSRFESFMTAEEAAKHPDPAGFVALMLDIAGVRMVEEACEKMIQADDHQWMAGEKFRELAQQRDDAARALYDLIVKVRKKVHAHFDGKQEKRYVGISGATPRQPFMLLRWSTAIRGALASEKLPVDRKKLDADSNLKKLEDLHEKLDKARAAAETAEILKEDARHLRTVAIESCNTTHIHCSQVIESILRAVGREDLARKVRGVARPGRPKKKVEKPETAEIAENAENAEEWASEGSLSPPKSFSSASRPSRRARKSFSWLPRLPRRAQESFSRLARAPRSARKSFSRLARALRSPRKSS